VCGIDFLKEQCNAYSLLNYYCIAQYSYRIKIEGKKTEYNRVSFEHAMKIYRDLGKPKGFEVWFSRADYLHFQVS